MENKPEKYIKILKFYRYYQTQHKRPPTLEEVMKAANLTSRSHAKYWIDKLVEDGKLEQIGADNESRNYSAVG